MRLLFTPFVIGCCFCFSIFFVSSSLSPFVFVLHFSHTTHTVRDIRIPAHVFESYDMNRAHSKSESDLWKNCNFNDVMSFPTGLQPILNIKKYFRE